VAKSKILHLDKEILFGFIQSMLTHYHRRMMDEHVWQYPFGRAEGRAIKAWLAFADSYTDVEWQKPEQYTKLNGINHNDLHMLKRYMFAWRGVVGELANDMSGDLYNDTMIRLGQSLQIVSAMLMNVHPQWWELPYNANDLHTDEGGIYAYQIEQMQRLRVILLKARDELKAWRKRRRNDFAEWELLEGGTGIVINFSDLPEDLSQLAGFRDESHNRIIPPRKDFVRTHGFGAKETFIVQNTAAYGMNVVRYYSPHSGQHHIRYDYIQSLKIYSTPPKQPLDTE